VHSLEEIEQRQGKLSIKSHGESVYTDIQEAVKENSYKARWFWELLQNAKDAVEDGQSVEVRLEVTDEIVKFSHTGSPFKIDEILELIIQGSSKRESENKTGRFGTGFITTYVLSLKVQIEGNLDDGNSFNFILDRDAENPDAFLKLQGECTKKFHASLTKETGQMEGEFATVFTYFLTPQTAPVAGSIFTKLNVLLPYVIAFNDKIKKVTVVHDGKHTTYEKHQSMKDWNEGLLPVEIKVDDLSYCEILMSRINKGIAATRIDHHEGRRVILPPSSEKVDLFFSFPLIGSEELALPMVINSENFDVRKERYGVFLGREETISNKRNKEIIDGAFQVFPVFLKWCKEHGVGQLYNLVRIQRHGDSADLDNEWLLKQKRDLVTLVENVAILKPTSAKDSIALRHSYIPDAVDEIKRTSLWKLYDQLKPEKLPDLGELEAWREIATEYVELSGSSESPTYLVNVENLCQLVSACNDRTTLKTSLGINDEINFLNDLYLLFSQQESKLFYSYNLVANQKNQLVKVDNTIRTDSVCDEQIKDILELMHQPTRAMLVSQQLKLPDNICGPLGLNECINMIIGILAVKKDHDYATNSLFVASTRFLKWLISHEQHDLVGSFKVVTAGHDKTGAKIFRQHTLSAFKGKKQKLLAPKGIWVSKFPIYAELINEKDCLLSAYGDELNYAELEYLSSRYFIHLQPLIRCYETPNRNILKQLLIDPSVIDDEKDEKDLAVEGNISYYDFAFFVNDEDYVFANNNSSRSSLRILEFVLREAVNVDPNFSSTDSIKIDGKEVPIKKSVWVNRLKSSAWINTRNTLDQGPKYLGGQPTSYNLAVLLNTSPDLKPLLKDQEIITLLGLLNVSVSDLIRNTLTSEKERLDWEKAFTALLVSNLDPTLAVTMLKDPALMDVYRKQQETRALISRNQGLGNAMESGFKGLFQTGEYNAQGIHVTRKPFGSDYIITFESSDLVNELGQEELFEIGGWFIELKATGKQYASMTPLQAKRAVENKRNYALVILPLGDFELTQINIWQHSKVISNIGEKLEPKYKQAQTTSVAQEALVAPSQFVEVHIEQNELRYRIKSALWVDGLSLDAFMKQTFIRPAGVTEASGSIS
jgi:hypothetical protein